MVDIGGLIERARSLAESGNRRILGITGPPAAGKGTIAREVVDELGPSAVLVPMDGFHLAGDELRRIGRHDWKGAPDTFDAAGYVALLRRLRAPGDEVVYAPEFHREVEESFAGAIAVAPEIPLVVTEGNYLLLDDGPFSAVRELLDETWFLAPDDATRVERLINRHVRHGLPPERARSWVHRSDERNAELIEPTRKYADLVVDPD